MAQRHIVERIITLLFGRKPVQAFPIIPEYVRQGIASGQRHTYTEAPFGAGRVGFNEVMLVAIIQATESLVIAAGSIP